MNARGLATWVAIGIVSGGLSGAAAAADDAKPTATPPVAATVNGDPIYVSEVLTLLRATGQGGAKNSTATNRAMADMLRQLINRRLAKQALKRDGGYFTDEEINESLETMKTQAAAQKLTLEEFAARQGVSIDTLRHESTWQIGWPRYVEKHLGDEMESYFKAHQKEFDGTRVRTSHILLRPERSNESSAQTVERANQIREQITSGKLTFEQAAEKYSAGPSGKKGGDLGFVPRFGVMFEGFAKAAFQVEIGQISEPIVSPFGVHLLRVSEVKPGTKQWTEVIEQMRGQPASVELFDKLAKQEGGEAKIEFTGNVPYFNPETNELVLPKTPAP